MKNFPSLCIDNFYNDPDSIRNFALSQEYQANPEGKWPGKRTIDISLIDSNFAQEFNKKIFSIYFDIFKTTISYKISSFFQKIEPYDDDPNSIKNSGWIHFDDAIFAGIIYLNKSN